MIGDNEQKELLKSLYDMTNLAKNYHRMLSQKTASALIDDMEDKIGTANKLLEKYK